MLEKKCPQCKARLEKKDIRIEHLNTWHTTWVYCAVCKKCKTIIGFLMENVNA